MGGYSTAHSTQNEKKIINLMQRVYGYSVSGCIRVPSWRHKNIPLETLTQYTHSISTKFINITSPRVRTTHARARNTWDWFQAKVFYFLQYTRGAGGGARDEDKHGLFDWTYWNGDKPITIACSNKLCVGSTIFIYNIKFIFIARVYAYSI